MLLPPGAPARAAHDRGPGRDHHAVLRADAGKCREMDRAREGPARAGGAQVPGGARLRARAAGLCGVHELQEQPGDGAELHGAACRRQRRPRPRQPTACAFLGQQHELQGLPARIAVPAGSPRGLHPHGRRRAG